MKKIDLLKLLGVPLFIMAIIMLPACGEDIPLPQSPAEEEIVDEPADEQGEEPGEEPVEEPEIPVEPPTFPEPEEPFSTFFEERDRMINAEVNSFGMDIFRAMINNADYSAKFPNAAISPLSLSYALAMAANTFDNQFASTVLAKMKGEDLGQLNTYFRKLMGNMPEGEALKLANSAWYFDGCILPSESYCSNLAKAYSAPVSPLDFSNANQAAALINGWVADHTANLIDKLITPDQLQAAKVVLTNALVFDGKWEYEFDEKLTKKGVFHGAKSDTRVDYLNIKEHYCCTVSDDATIIAMPFYGGAYDLMVFMPNEGETFSSVAEGLDHKKLETLHAEMPECIVELSMPKFSSELHSECTDLIESLGIPMRSKQHTLSGFTGDEFTEFDRERSDVIHAAKMSINEKGALAASATAIIDWSGGLPEPYTPQEVKLTFDRPFFYIIRDNRYGSIIIAGCYTQP